MIFPKLNELIENMWETMYGAYGVGLAAPQVGLPVRLFMIDTSPFAEDEDLDEQERKELEGLKKVFINPTICWISWSGYTSRRYNDVPRQLAASQRNGNNNARWYSRI